MSSAPRFSGRWAANTVVASQTPSATTREVTIAMTMKKATVPRPVGPRARASSRTEMK